MLSASLHYRFFSSVPMRLLAMGPNLDPDLSLCHATQRFGAATSADLTF